MDTIFVLNTNRQVIDVLSNNGSNPSAPFFGDTYTSELDTGAESYEFTTINNARTNVTLEVGNYVLFKYNGKYKLFQIMETTDEHSEGKKLLTVYAEMAGMELRNDYCEPFTLEGNFINLLERVLQDTNWRVGTYSESLLYNIQSISYTEPKNVYSIIQENLATFGGVEIEFRVEFIGNQLAALLIDCYESGTRGNKKYRRFEYGKDVKGITRERNINDLATAVIGQGNNNLTFKDIEWSKSLGNPCDKPLQQNFVVDIDANDLWNNGGKYIKTVHKVDTDDPQTLLQECWDYLQEIKQPKFDYDVDLALVAEDYQDIGVGDTNYVLDFDYQPAILLEARVGKLELSFADPRDNKCTLTNYKELVSILQQPVDLNTVGNMIQSKFPIGGEDIAMGAIGEGHIEVTYYQAIKTDIMNATLANVDTLIANKVDTEDLNAINADIENLRANKAEITDLNAANGNITNLTSQVGQIETIINGHFTGTDAQVLNITAQNTTFDNAVIKNAMIDSVSANKVNTGTLNTNNVNIESEDGGIKISGTTQQFKDKEGHVRVQIGKDAQGNFTFCLFSQDGVGILLDETGIKAGAVPNGLIVNDMVSDTANIAGSKLDISSVITSINNNTTSIKSSVIKFDDTGQTLQVAFNELKTKVDTIDEVVIGGNLSSVIEQVTTNTTNIGVMQGQISSLISNTTITKEDGTVVQLKDEYNSTKDTVNSHTTKIGSLETNYNKVSTDFNNLSIGGRNLYLDTKEYNDSSKWTNYNDYTKTNEYFNGTIVMSRAGTWEGLYQPITLEENTIYTLSAWIKGDGNSDLRFYGYTPIKSNFVKEEKISTEWKRYYVTFNAESGVANTARFENGISDASMYIAGLKLEKGNKATDWTPAPEDVDSEITTIKNNVASVTSKQTEFKQDLDGFKTTVSSTYTTKTEFDNLSIGGTNLFILSECTNSYIKGTVGENVAANSQGKSMTTLIPVGNNTHITYQVWNPNKHTNTTNKNRIACYDSNSTIIKTLNLPQLNGTDYQTQIFTFPDNTAYIKLGAIMGSTAGFDENMKVKFEFGNKATDWSPAPEDMTTKDEFNNLEIGTRNLLRNGAFLSSTNYWELNSVTTLDEEMKFNGHPSIKIVSSGYTASKYYGAVNKYLPDNVDSFLAGDTYTYSCWYYVEDTSTFDKDFRVRLRGIVEGNTNSNTISDIRIGVADLVQGKWTKISKTVTFSANATNCYLQPCVRQNGTIWVTDVQLERGERATDWTPAPEDVEEYTNSSIASSEKALNTNIDSAVDKAKTDTLAEVKDKYTSKTDYQEFKKSTASSFEQTSKDITMKFDDVTEKTTSIGGELKEFKSTVSTNIKFSEDGINIGKNNSPFSVNINNEQMSFRDGGQDVAYISNQEMLITDTNITNSLRLGSFIFFPRSNGNTSLVWDDKGNLIQPAYAYCNKSNSDYPTYVAVLGADRPSEGDIITIELSGALASTANFWGVHNTGGMVLLCTLWPWEARRGVIRKSFIWVTNTSDGNNPANSSEIHIYPMPYVDGRGISTITSVKLYRGDNYWGNSDNLIKYNNLGYNGDKYSYVATQNNHEFGTDIYGHLTTGKTYKFTCDTDCANWSKDSNVDGVYVILKRVNNYGGTLETVEITSVTDTFTIPTAGIWKLSFCLSKNGTSHWFTNAKVVEVITNGN